MRELPPQLSFINTTFYKKKNKEERVKKRLGGLDGVLMPMRTLLTKGKEKKKREGGTTTPQDCGQYSTTPEGKRRRRSMKIDSYISDPENP